MNFLRRLLQRDAPLSVSELQAPVDSVQSTQQMEQNRPKLPTLQQVLAACEPAAAADSPPPSVVKVG